MATVTIKWTGKIEIDKAGLARKVAPLILGRILERTDAEMDGNWQPFDSYSAAYAWQRVQIGEDTRVTIRLSGGELGSFHHKRTDIVGGFITLTFGVGTGTSATIDLPPPWMQNNPTALAAWKAKHGGKASRTGGRSPPHTLLAYWQNNGIGQPKREWMKFDSPQDLAWLAEQIEKTGIFKQG